MARVELDRISKSFGRTRVLRDVSIAIGDGEFLTLLGPSGCGKSTLLRIIAGLEQQDAGSISIDGVGVDDRVPKQRDVAMVFQSYALYPYMSVFENLALPLVMRRASRAQRLPLVGRLMPGARLVAEEIAARVGEVARALAIEDLLRRRPSQISGGQRQRVAVGRAMVRDPKVFLMDEPLSNLDAKLRVHMRAELADLHRRLGATFIYVTHDQSEAMTMSNRVAVMIDGALLQVAPPGALYADPVSLRVAEFVGSPRINVVPATAGAGSARALGVALPLAVDAPAGAAIQLGIRAEALSPQAADAPHGFAGRVRHVENLGADCFVHVAVDGLDAPLIARAAGGRAGEFRVGAPVGVAPDPAGLLAFDSAGARLRARLATPRSAAHG